MIFVLSLGNECCYKFDAVSTVFSYKNYSFVKQYFKLKTIFNSLLNK